MPVVSVRRTVRFTCWASCQVSGSTMASWVFSKISQSDGSFFYPLIPVGLLEERKFTVCPIYSGLVSMELTVKPYQS